jgi:hypothetical protein
MISDLYGPNGIRAAAKTTNAVPFLHPNIASIRIAIVLLFDHCSIF